MELEDRIFVCAEVHSAIQFTGNDCPLCLELKRNDFLREKIKKLNRAIEKQNIRLRKLGEIKDE
jgi:hypothetical protein